MAFDRDFKCFFPLSVTRKTVAGEETIPISNLQVGDCLLLRNGELIPADARLVSGPACIDYSFVTGEAEPWGRRPGDYLYAGGRQIGGVIEVETVKAVSQSHLTSLWNHEAFQKERVSSLNTLTNGVSRWFTLGVITMAVGAGMFWLIAGDAGRGMKAFISVLIVACPCALALAAPFALGTAQRLLARRQVFLKNGLVLERMAQVQAIVFDKTGTLTGGGAEAVKFCARAEGGRQHAEGDARMADGKWQMANGEQSLLRSAATEEGLTGEERGWAGAVARHSTHPLAVRIGQALAEESMAGTVEGFAETAGCGIEAACRARGAAGSRAWLSGCGVAVPEDLLLQKGSMVCLAIDGKLRGVRAGQCSTA